MAGFRGACRGTLGAQLNLLAPDGTLLTGPGNVIALPKEAITNITETAETRTIAEVDEPCLNIPEQTLTKSTGGVEVEFCATTDFETIELAAGGTWATYGDGTTVWGIEQLCAAASCFCSTDVAANGIALTVWGCARGCNGGILTDDNGDIIYCLNGYAKLTNPTVTGPGIVGAEGTPERWTISFTSSPNPNYGQGPGGAFIKLDDLGAPAGPECWRFRGHTNVAPPIDCDSDCASLEVGYDTEIYALA